MPVKEESSKQILYSSLGISKQIKAQAQTDQWPDSPSYLRVHSRPDQEILTLIFLFYFILLYYIYLFYFILFISIADILVSQQLIVSNK